MMKYEINYERAEAFSNGADWSRDYHLKTMIPMSEVEKLVGELEYCFDRYCGGKHRSFALSNYKQFIENRNKTEEK